MSEFTEVQKLFKDLCKQQIFGFPKPRKELRASKKRGVYVIMNRNRKVVHVGGTPRAKDGIHQRLRDHLYGRSSFARNQLCGKENSLRKSYKYRYLEVPNARERVLLECYATAHLCPSYVGLGKKRS